MELYYPQEAHQLNEVEKQLKELEELIVILK